MASGIALSPYAGVLPGRLLWILLWTAILVLLLVRGRKVFVPVYAAAFVCFGMLYAREDGRRPADAVEKIAPSAVWVIAEGVVDGEATVRSKGGRRNLSLVLDARRLIVRLPDTRWKNENVSGKIQAYLYHFGGRVPEPGDWVRLRGMLERTRPAMNPGEFDLRAYLAARGRYAVLRGGGDRAAEVLAPGSRLGWKRILAWVRAAVARRADRTFGPQGTAFFKALILGTRSQIDPRWKEAFLKTGTSHLFAISGMNIALVAGSLYLVLLFMRLPQTAAAASALAASAGYVLISGLGVPVCRAGIMTGGALAALLFERERNSLNLLFVAFFVLELADPKCLFDLSFQLSFLSVGSLLVLHVRLPFAGPVEPALNQGAAVCLGTFPVVLYHFHIFSLSGLAANLAVIPVFHLALLGAFSALAAADIPVAGGFLSQVSERLLALGLAIIRESARPAWGYLYACRPALWQILAYYLSLGGMIFIKAAGFPGPRLARWTAGLLWASVTAAFFIRPSQPDFRFTLLAAGQGQIGHLDFGGAHHWLIDAGRSGSSERVWRTARAYLRSLAVRRLTGVLLADGSKINAAREEFLSCFYPEIIAAPPRELFLSAGPGLPPQASKNRSVWLRSGTRIFDRRKPGRYLEVLGIVNRRAILKLRLEGTDFVLVPEFTDAAAEAMTELPGPNPAAVHRSVLVLPAIRQFDARRMAKLLERTRPDAVIVLKAGDELVRFLTIRRIKVLPLERTGAITFYRTGGGLGYRGFMGESGKLGTRSPA